MNDWLPQFVEQLRLVPNNLANHLLITVIPLAVGAGISLPLGVFVSRRARWRYPTLAVVSLIQTIPSLALLALTVPVLAILGTFTAWALGFSLSALGFWPTVIALTLYSMLPMVRNTVVGLLGVDAAVAEAATGMGMTSRQKLWSVELPLALPTILAGLRTATVWVVGIATLSTPVGQRSLGNFIFRGLQTRQWTMVLIGCVAAALLAIVLDLLIGGLERAAQRRSKTLGWTCGGLLIAIFTLGLAGPQFVAAMTAPALPAAVASATTQPTASDNDDEAPADAASAAATVTRHAPIRIGAKTFTEQYILAALLETQLHHHGLPTRRLESLGSTVVFDALAAGEIDVYVDYSGTLWANVLKRQGSADRQTVLETVTYALAKEQGIRCLGSLGFENAYALAMRRGDADARHITAIGALAALSPALKIGGDYEFFGRPEWRALRSGYDLRFKEEVSYDSTFMYQAVAQGAVDVISAFSSDGRIAAYDLVTLADLKQIIPPYDAVLLVGPNVADDEAVIAALRPLVGAISIDNMRHANLSVDRDDNKQTPRQAAAWLWQQMAEH